MIRDRKVARDDLMSAGRFEFLSRVHAMLCTGAMTRAAEYLRRGERKAALLISHFSLDPLHREQTSCYRRARKRPAEPARVSSACENSRQQPAVA
jgi:hypothetical protein